MALDKVKNVAGKVRRAIAFFSTLIGQVVFFIIAALLVALLVYVIVSVILKDIAKIIGIDGGAQSGKESYQFLRDLSSSGYDEMLNAQELIEYHAFEYAVLMDAARFMEETGTQKFEVIDTSPINFEELHDGSNDREEWAFLAALAFCKTQSSADGTFNDSTASGLGLTNLTPPDPPENVGKLYTTYDAAFNSSGFDTDHTKENLFYRPVYNEYTKEDSLYPYLEITRNYDIVRYYIEYMEDPDAMQQVGYTWTFGPKSNVFWVQHSRFEVQDNSANYRGLQASYDFILNYLFPLHICRKLNATNIRAYEESDPMHGSFTGPIDLYETYYESLYYTTGQAPTHHKIPLRILLDRFLPNAVLLSSWRILKDDTVTSEDVVDEIQRIYTESCLDGETSEGEKLLVKDVGVIYYAISENTKATQLFDKVSGKDVALQKYLDGEETSVIYDSYAPLFDSRIWATNREEPEEENPEGGVEGDSTQEPSVDLAVNPQQEFEGTFAEDVYDDIRLILTHYSTNFTKVLSVENYEKIMDDVESIVTPLESSPTSDEEFIIYTPLATGGYLANCKYGKESNHYNGENHVNYTDPYSANEEIQKCFVPFLKIGYTQRNGLRITTVIINDRGEYKGYMVKGREIADYGKLSNENTFAFFETRDMQCTTVRHWKITTAGEVSMEKWFVEDAFEGLDIDIGSDLGDLVLYVNYSKYDPGRGEDEDKFAEIPWLAEYMNYTDEEREEILDKVLINGMEQIEGENVLPKESLAIVRNSNDSKSNRNFPDQDLETTKDASIMAEETGEYMGGNSLYTGGETQVTDDEYINLKLFDLQAGDAVPVDTSQTGDLDRYANFRGFSVEDILILYLYLEDDFTPEILDDPDIHDILRRARAAVGDISFHDTPSNYHLQLEECDEEYYVVMPTRRSIIPITQEFWDKKLRFYLVKGSELWSSEKIFANTLTVVGEFKNRDNFMYIINSNPYCKGLEDYKCTKWVNWRAKMFAPIFAGNDSANTNARETDVLLILSEWLEASEQGLHAADHFIRDLYSLVNYSKGIPNEEGFGYEVEPIYKTGNTPYINPGSYTYLYIPDEILKFDDTTSEMAFWQDRIICTPSDPIEQDVENYLRSQAPTFTWQIVDYDLYEECQNGNGTARVYPLWMFGDQMSRTMYAMASNASASEHDKVFSGWGGYASGMHAAADLYGRNIATKIYTEIFGNVKNPQAAKISATYSAGSAGLSDTENTSGDGFYFGYNEDSAYIEEGNNVAVQNINKAMQIINKAIEDNDTDLIKKIIDALLADIKNTTEESESHEGGFSVSEDQEESQGAVINIDKAKLKEEILTAINEGNKDLAKSKIFSIFTNNGSTIEKIIDYAGADYVPEVSNGNADIEAGGTAGTGLYFNNVPVKLVLGGKEYTFSGTAAATYGYELYRQTLILKDGEKAEELLKKQLETEMKWTALRAVAPGIVTEVKADARGGFTVRIKHSENVATGYLHMKRYPLVQVGQYVGAGTLIGYEGTTGNSGTFHVHFTIRKENDPKESQALVNPVTYMYPFFTPFYYAEKAEEAGYTLDSDYMSTTRTVFPYGQISGAGSPYPWSPETEGGMVKIKNYVPYKIMVEDSSWLYYEDSGFEGFIDYSKLPTKNLTTDLEGSKYGGPKLTTNPNYFNRAFMAAVNANGGKIEGVMVNWADVTQFQIASGDSMPSE